MELLLECFSEEIPARMQVAAMEQLLHKAKAALEAAHLSYQHMETHVTPRRLVLMVQGLPATQPDRDVEKKGPRASAPEAALEGFLRSNGITKDQLELRGEGKDATYYYSAKEVGQPTADVLKPLLEEMIHGFHWPKSMRWGSEAQFRWVRPLKNLLCVLDGVVVPLQVAHVTANNQTWGHRFLAPQVITVSSIAQYKAALAEASVVLNREERKAQIVQQASAVAEAAGLRLREDAGLLEEVTGLVEYPVAILGRFEERYMALPPEVIITVMRSHQKYFAVEDASGALANGFVTISNMQTADAGAAIRAGNERVLRARLADGEFYWEGDRNTPLESRLPKLEDVVFHAKVGRMSEKVGRIAGIAKALANALGLDASQTQRAAQLCKADLVSGMVGEFPELQGVMGSYYAKHQKEDAEVVRAIAEHYQPQGPNDACPTAPVSVVVALADKLDSLVSLFAAGEKPTGSKDPFALRRAALSILRLMQENRLGLSIRQVVGYAAGSMQAEPAVVAEVEAFILDRLKVSLRDQGFRHDHVAAVLREAAKIPLHQTVATLDALRDMMAGSDGENLLAAYKRARNIVAAEEKKDKTTFAARVQADKLQEASEKALYAAVQDVQAALQPALEAADYRGAMQQLASLRAPLDAFFEAVLVNEAGYRENRLSLLVTLIDVMDSVADFSQMEGGAVAASEKRHAA